MSKWTKGPWLVPHLANDDCECSCGYVLADGYCGAVATVHVDNGELVGNGGNDSPSADEAKANARLIAQAPVLAERLASLIDELEGEVIVLGMGESESIESYCKTWNDAKQALQDAGWYDE